MNHKVSANVKPWKGEIFVARGKWGTNETPGQKEKQNTVRKVACIEKPTLLQTEWNESPRLKNEEKRRNMEQGIINNKLADNENPERVWL